MVTDGVRVGAMNIITRKNKTEGAKNGFMAANKLRYVAS